MDHSLRAIPLGKGRIRGPDFHRAVAHATSLCPPRQSTLSGESSIQIRSSRVRPLLSGAG